MAIDGPPFCNYIALMNCHTRLPTNRTERCIIFILCALIAFLSINATAKADPKAETEIALTALVNELASSEYIPSVLLQIEMDGYASFSLAAGHETLREEKPVNPDTLFRTASVGKLFTAVATLRLVEKKVISLEDPIGMYLKGDLVDRLHTYKGKVFGPQITIRQLLGHTSGLPDFDDDPAKDQWMVEKGGTPMKPEELIEFAIHLGPKFKPGEGQLYSSAGYMLLGLVLESATGRPYHSIVRNEVLNPLGLKNTFEEASEMPPDRTLAHSYVGTYDMAQIHPSMEFADGGFATTTADLVRFGKMLAQGAAFSSQETLRTMMESQGRKSIGLGPFLGMTENGHRYFYHPGFWGSMLFVMPDDGISIAFTLNQSEADIELFLDQVLEIVTR